MIPTIHYLKISKMKCIHFRKLLLTRKPSPLSNTDGTFIWGLLWTTCLSFCFTLKIDVDKWCWIILFWQPIFMSVKYPVTENSSFEFTLPCSRILRNHNSRVSPFFDLFLIFVSPLLVPHLWRHLELDFQESNLRLHLFGSRSQLYNAYLEKFQIYFIFPHYWLAEEQKNLCHSIWS